MKFLSIYFLFFLVGCVRNKIDKLTGVETHREIVCYSGEKQIYKGITRSRVNYERNFTMWNDEKGEVVMIKGVCIVTSPDKTETATALE